MRAAKVDANQGRIVDVLRASGAKVFVASSVGGGFPDLLAGYRGRLYLLEVKDGAKPPSARKLTLDQVKFHAEWEGYPLHVVKDEAEALQAIGCSYV